MGQGDNFKMSSGWNHTESDYVLLATISFSEYLLRYDFIHS